MTPTPKTKSDNPESYTERTKNINKRIIPISQKALLLELSISLFGKSSQDAEITNKVLIDNKSKGGGRFVRERINPKAKDVKDVFSSAQAIRTFIYAISCPWSQSQRIIPVESYVDNISNINVLIDAFNTRVDTLCKNLNSLEAIEKVRQGNLFRKETFPTESEIRSGCKVRINLSPISDPTDFRVDSISKDLLDEIQIAMKESVKESIVSAQKEVLKKMTSLLSNLQNRLKDGKRFKINSIDNILNYAFDLKNYGEVFNSDEMMELGKKITNFIQSKDAETLRKNEAERTQTEKRLSNFMTELDSIVEKM